MIESHPEVIAAQVYTIPHPEFGSVLAARVELSTNSVLTAEVLSSWLSTGKRSSFQM